MCSSRSIAERIARSSRSLPGPRRHRRHSSQAVRAKGPTLWLTGPEETASLQRILLVHRLLDQLRGPNSREEFALQTQARQILPTRQEQVLDRRLLGQTGDPQKILAVYLVEGVRQQPRASD